MSTFFLQDLIKDTQIETAINHVEESTQIPEEEKENTIEMIYDRVENPSQFRQLIGWIGSAVSIPLRVFFFTLIVILVGNFIFGGNSTYGLMMTITSYAYLVTVPELLVKIPLMLNKWSVKVYTGLGLLNIGEPDSFIQMFLAGIDLFAVWRIILISIGMGLIYKKGTKQVFLTLTSVWVVLLIVQIAITKALI